MTFLPFTLTNDRDQSPAGPHCRGERSPSKDQRPLLRTTRQPASRSKPQATQGKLRRKGNRQARAPDADDMVEQTFAETALGLLAEVETPPEHGSDGEWEG